MRRQVLILVWVDGKRLSGELSRSVISLSFTFPKNKGASGKLTILDPDFGLFDSNLFRKGQRIAFLCGWKHELVPVGPFIVKGPSPDCPEAGQVSLVVDFQDKSHKMNKKQKRKKWTGSPTSILKSIAETHNLGYDIDEIKGVEFSDDLPLIQANMTDAALIQRLAWRYGFVWGVYGNNLVFKNPTDMEQSGQQKPNEIPVLRYKHGDYSLKSFAPEIKFSKGGRRKNKKVTSDNIDLENQMDEANEELDGLDIEEAQSKVEEMANNFQSESTIETLKGSFTGLSDMFGLSGDQTFSDEDMDQTNKKFDKEVQVFMNEFDGKLRKYSKTPKEKDEENLESDIGDPSGTASAANSEEAQKKQAGKLIRASQTTEGTAVPTVASMYYRPRQAVILAGLGRRLSGKYEAIEVTQTLSGEGDTFVTSLKVMKRKFFPAPKDAKKISDTEGTGQDAAVVPGTEDTSKGKPGPPRVYMDEMTGETYKKVNGKRVNESTPAKKTATVETDHYTGSRILSSQGFGGPAEVVTPDPTEEG